MGDGGWLCEWDTGKLLVRVIDQCVVRPGDMDTYLEGRGEGWEKEQASE